MEWAIPFFFSPHGTAVPWSVPGSKPGRSTTLHLPGHMISFGIPCSCLFPKPAAPLNVPVSILISALLLQIYTAELRSALAMDTYILKGDPSGETYTPTFTYHGFRFVELSGFPGIPNHDNIECYHVYTDNTRTGVFSTQNKLLNRFQSNIVYTQQSNMLGYPSDCPQRDERQGWTADAHLSSEAFSLNFDMAAFFHRWVSIHQDDAINGTLPDTIPNWNKWPVRRHPGDPAWTSSYFIVADVQRKFYNDLTLIKEQYQGFKNYIEYYEINLPKVGGLVNMCVSFFWLFIHCPGLTLSSLLVHLNSLIGFLLLHILGFLETSLQPLSTLKL
jgi:hypothetical protein